jgi:hypothetical protein
MPADESKKLDAFNRLCEMPDALIAALGYRVTHVAKCCEAGCEKCGGQGYVRVFDSTKGRHDAAPKTP